MDRFTFLTEEQCLDSSRKLEILEKRGTIAPITDFSILLGGFCSSYYYYNNSNLLEDRAGWYWTSSNDKDNAVRGVDYDGFRINHKVYERSGGVRPVLPYSSIRNIASNGVRGRDGILEVEYGEYPQKVASKRLQDELERAYNYNQSSIRKTGKTYTTDSREYNEYGAKFSAQIIEEYSFNDGKKYVRVKANSSYDGSDFRLSNGERYKDGDYVWVEVQPVKWLIDEKSNIALSERLLFAGVQFKHERNYKGDFRTTDIKKFMNNYFSKDLLRTRKLIQTKSTSINKSGLFSLIKNRFNKKEIEPVEIIEIKEEPQIEKKDSLKDIMESIDFLLVKLGKIDKDLQIAKTKEYENMLDSENQILTLYPFLDKSLESFRDDLKIILENLQIKNESILDYLNSMINEYNMGKTPQTLSDIDKLYETFESSKEKYPLTTQRKFIFDLGLLYIYEIYENRNNITVERLNNSYFRDNLKIILVRLNELINSGIVENNFVIDFDEEITIDYVLECIKKIKFVEKNKKEIKKI